MDVFNDGATVEWVTKVRRRRVVILVEKVPEGRRPIQRALNEARQLADSAGLWDPVKSPKHQIENFGVFHAYRKRS